VARSAPAWDAARRQSEPDRASICECGICCRTIGSFATQIAALACQSQAAAAEGSKDSPMTMLDRMRRHKGWLKWSLALVVLTFIVFYIPDFLGQNTATTLGAAPREVIAEVDGHDLTAGEFQQRYQQQLQAYQQQFGGNINEQLIRQLGIDQQILTQMVDEQVAVIEAGRHGLKVSDDELAEQIFAIPGLQENGRFIGEQRYEQLLRAQRPPMTKAEFEESLRRSMVIDKLRAALTDWIAVSDAEVEREFKQRNEKVKLQVVALTADKFRDKVNVSDADVAAYFDAHKAEYRVGEQRKIKYLLIDRDQARQRAQVTPAEVDRYYNQNIQQFQTPEQVRASHILLKTDGKNEEDVRKQAEEILKKARAGEDFAALARQYSEDTSKDQGGDLGLFGRGRMVPEFETAAFAMQPGQISDLVKSQYGYHIIKVTERKEATTTPLEQVRPQIQQQLAAQMADTQIADKARQLADQIKTASDLEKVAKEQGLTVQESGFFQREDPVPGLGASPQVAQEAFRLKDGEVSAPVTSARGPLFMVVSQKKDPYVPKLEEVSAKVREDAIRARAAELSRQRAGEIAASLRGAKDFAAAAKAQGLEAKTTDLITRGSTLPDVGISPEVDAVAFTLPVNGVSDPIRLNDATVIVRVAERDEVTPDELTREKETFRAELLNERRNRFFTAYMSKAKERTRIELKQDVLRRVTQQNAI
jgi:peptidyl-prolyl cis-trans isomerase D